MGYGLGTGLHSYDVIRGSLFNELISYGLDEQTAMEFANDDAIVESIIESGESVKDWLFMFKSKGASAPSKATGKLASTMAKYVFPFYPHKYLQL